MRDAHRGLDAPALGPNPLGPAPCDGCQLAPRCKAQLEACEAFVLYVNLFNEKRWRGAPREPQHATYRAAMQQPGRRGLRSPNPIIPATPDPAQ